MTAEYIVTIIGLGFVGLVMGSFAGAQVWRLRAHQLEADKKAGYSVSKNEFRRLKPLLVPIRRDRSHCLNCGHVLEFIDLIPLVSWLSTAGRCRYCKHSIGLFEPVVELSVAAMFILSFVVWPYALDSTMAVLLFGVWLIALVVAAILFVYDLKWFLLPDKANYVFIGLGAIFAVGQLYLRGFSNAGWVSLAGALLVLSGLYGALYLYSRLRNGEERTWVGFGDVKLGLGLGFFSLSWPIAFLTLFLANFIGTLLVLPGLLRGKLDRHSHIPFGPLLLIGMVIAVLFGQQIIDLYIRLFLF